VAGTFPLPYSVRRSPRAKRLRLVVKPSGLELVLPGGMDEAGATAFLHQHKDWALRQVAALQARLPPPPPAGSVPFQGREVPLLVTEQPSRRARVTYDGSFRIGIPAGTPEQVEQRTRAALLGWAKGWLQAESRHIAEQQGQHHGLLPRQIRIKQMKSRWGSCGPQGDINLNLVLAFAPPAVLEYVVVHEICHLRHRDHSERFWDLVAAHLPEFRSHRLWLRHHGAELLRRFG
jgi:predicted metal-dependent hydrolase